MKIGEPERETAWWRLHDALPAGWRIGVLTFDPAGEVNIPAAMSPKPRGRGHPPERVMVGRGGDELAAVRALADVLVAEFISALDQAPHCLSDR